MPPALRIALPLLIASIALSSGVMAGANSRDGCMNQWLFNGIWRVEVTGVALKGDTLAVAWKLNAPKPGQPVTLALTHPGLGAVYAPDQWMRQHNLPGVMVYRVTPGGPAAKAGLQPLRRGQLGDIITAADGKEVQTASDLDAALDEHNIGDTVTLSILRGGPNGQKMDVKVTLQGEAAQQ